MQIQLKSSDSCIISLAQCMPIFYGVKYDLLLLLLLLLLLPLYL